MQDGTEDRRKHLEFIEAVIARMANSSFVIKGWSVTLTAALFALAAKDAEGRYVIIAYLPVIAFWCLDGYYLQQERLFRGLYNAAKSGDLKTYEMDTTAYAQGNNTWRRSALSPTLLLFHGTLLATVVVVMVITTCRTAGHGA
jgi:hypothetical protein